MKNMQAELMKKHLVLLIIIHIKGKLALKEDRITHTLPNGHGYDTAPGTMETYVGTLQDTFYGFREIQFENEDGTTVEFDQVGEPSKPMELGSGKNYYNYYLFKQEMERNCSHRTLGNHMKLLKKRFRT